MPKIASLQEKKARRPAQICRILKKGSEKPKKKEKSFECYHSLPAEVRMVVVDEMEPVDRCKFSQCSILSSMEAKRSKNYMYSLGFHVLYDNLTRITVQYDNNGYCRFYLEFQQQSGKKFIKCTSSRGKQAWRTELPGSTDLVQYAANYFKDILRDYQNSIKKLRMKNCLKNKLQNFDFGIRSLKNLERLDMNFNSAILEVTKKLRKPLKKLTIDGKENNQQLENYEISRISETICLPHFKLNYQQFIQLSAKNVSINIGELTEEDICKIIKNWQKQPTGDKVINYEWYLYESDFDVAKLLRLLGAKDPHTEERVLMKIKHGFEKGIEAKLIRCDKFLLLKTNLNLD